MRFKMAIKTVVKASAKKPVKKSAADRKLIDEAFSGDFLKGGAPKKAVKKATPTAPAKGTQKKASKIVPTDETVKEIIEKAIKRTIPMLPNFAVFVSKVPEKETKDMKEWAKKYLGCFVMAVINQTTNTVVLGPISFKKDTDWVNPVEVSKKFHNVGLLYEEKFMALTVDPELDEFIRLMGKFAPGESVWLLDAIRQPEDKPSKKTKKAKK
jgi:hypothetical protein